MKRTASGFSLGEYHAALVGNFDQLHRLRGLHRHCDVQQVFRRDENRSSIAFFVPFIAGDFGFLTLIQSREGPARYRLSPALRHQPFQRHVAGGAEQVRANLALLKGR
jgi:hypothetical protein